MNLSPDPSSSHRPYGYFILLGVLFVWFAFLLSEGITRPWVNFIDFNGAVWSQAAHNILRAGLAETQGASTAFYFGPLPIPDAGYYLHHPPLLHLCIAGLFAILGEHEWVARLLPIGCSLGSAVLIWLLVANCLSTRAALLSVAVFVSLPMELRYGKMVNFEPMVLLLVLAALLALRYWSQTGRVAWKWAAMGSLFVGMWVDWPMHIFVLVLFVWWIRQSDPRLRRLAWTLLGMSVVSGVLYLLRIQLLRPDAMEDLHRAFVLRVASDDRCQFTQWQWVCKIANTLLHHYLGVNLVAASLGAIVAFRRRKEEGMAWICFAAGSVVAMDALFVGVFQNDSYIHAYIPFYFVLPVSLMAGVLLDFIIQSVNDAALEFGKLRRGTGNWIGALLVLAVAGAGQMQTGTLRRQYHILAYQDQEQASLIPSLGRTIASHFAPGTLVLCNFMPYYGPHLYYYAQRELATNLSRSNYWKAFIKRSKKRVGGIVWMRAPYAKEIVSSLPPGQKEMHVLDNETFCIWKPFANTGAN